MSKAFGRLFGTRWREQGADDKTLEVWLRAFQVAHLTVEDVSRGLALASQLTWPPTAGEFIALVRPGAPGEVQAYGEAFAWAGDPTLARTWSHPAIGAAAGKVGAWNLRHQPEGQAMRMFAGVYREMVDKHRRGEELTVPNPLQLTHERVSEPEFEVPRMSAAEAIADLRRSLVPGGDA